MDRHRGGERYVNSNNNSDPFHYKQQHPRGGPPSSRTNFSHGSMSPHPQHHRRSPNAYRGPHRPAFDSPPRYPPTDAVAVGSGGDGVDSGRFHSNYQMPPQPPPFSGQKRAYPFSSDTSGSPDGVDEGGFAKLFVGSVPRIATEVDIRPLFEEQGRVLEVAFIRDKRTGQQQGCCFIKYATSAEADRAIRALHNQYTLPGGIGPIQVRYADGERERLGAVEYKLFVGSLNKQATEKEVEEIFSPYGRVEDVYLMRDDMKQSRGCGFVKYSHKHMAMAAINSLSGKYTMRGCDQPLTVRFADPKRPKPGEPRGGGPAFGGPGFGPRFPTPGIRPPPNIGEPLQDQTGPNAWHPMSPESLRPISNQGMHGFGNQFPPRTTDTTVPSSLKPIYRTAACGNRGSGRHLDDSGGSFGSVSGTGNGFLTGLAASSAPTSQLSAKPLPTGGSQISQLQKPLQSPQHLPSSGQLQPPASTPSSQGPMSHALFRQMTQVQMSQSASQGPFSQGMPSQQSLDLTCQSTVFQPQMQRNMSSAMGHTLLNNNMQLHVASAIANQQPVPQHLVQHLHQPPSQLAQMLSQQTQNLQASFQSSQQTFTQLQQQLQLMQPSNESSAVQQGTQDVKQQSPWPGFVQQAPPSSTAVQPKADALPASSTASGMNQITGPVKCNWTEHTSPDGFKYYYDSITGESRWEKPEELISYEQQQQKLSAQQPRVQAQPHGLPYQQAQMQAQLQCQLPPYVQTQVRPPQQLQQASQGSPYAVGMTGQQPTQGIQAAQEWMCKNKPAGA